MACDPPKFAFVRFLDDNVKASVAVADIKRFKPTSVNDFNPDKPYWVLWSNGELDEEDFYKAQVLKLAASKEELEEQLAISRVRIPKVIDTSIEETTEDEGAAEVDKVAKEKAGKKKLMKKSTAPSQPLKTVLESRIKGKRASPLFASTPVKRRNEDRESENEKALQKKIAHLKRELSSSQEDVQKLNKKLSETRGELSQCKTTNKRLQNALLLKIETSVSGSKDGGKSSCQSLQSSSMMSGAVADLDISSPSKDVLEEKDGMVHIGADIWLNNEKWDDISSQTRHSMFVKNLLVAIWGTSVLKEKSLDGKVCPRFKNEREAKPPLSPMKVAAMKRRFSRRLEMSCQNPSVRQAEASRFNKYVTEKLQDVSRKRQLEHQQGVNGKASEPST